MMVYHPYVSRHSAALARMALGVALGASGLSCVGRTDEPGATGSETHFLIECSETCAAGLDCIGGVCTSPCTSNEGCAIWSSAAVCSAEPAAVEPGVCDVQCSVAADCATLGAGYRCEAGACRSAARVDAELGASRLPAAFDVLELRRIDNDEPPAAGSNCDPAELTRAYFIDLPARQVSWVYCEDDARNNIWLRSAGQWPLADDDRDALLAAYAQLQPGVSDLCVAASGGAFLDVTTADAARFSYGDDALGGCSVTQLGRVPITNLSTLYAILAERSYNGPRGVPREDSTER